SPSSRPRPSRSSSLLPYPCTAIAVRAAPPSGSCTRKNSSVMRENSFQRGRKLGLLLLSDLQLQFPQLARARLQLRLGHLLVGFQLGPALRAAFLHQAPALVVNVQRPVDAAAQFIDAAFGAQHAGRAASHYVEVVVDQHPLELLVFVRAVKGKLDADG